MYYHLYTYILYVYHYGNDLVLTNPPPGGIYIFYTRHRGKRVKVPMFGRRIVYRSVYANQIAHSERSLCQYTRRPRREYTHVYNLFERVSTAHGHYATNGTCNMHVIIITIQTYVIIHVHRIHITDLIAEMRVRPSWLAGKSNFLIILEKTRLSIRVRTYDVYK